MAGHVARMGRSEVHEGFFGGDPRERDHFIDLGVDGRIVLKWIFQKWNRVVWTGPIWLRTGTSCELL